jgi:hypothetical protein
MRTLPMVNIFAAWYNIREIERKMQADAELNIRQHIIALGVSGLPLPPPDEGINKLECNLNNRV